MSLLSFISFLIAMFLLAIVPGPGVFATISRSLASGFISSLSVIAGIITGDLFFLMFAFMGISTVANIFEQFFIVVKILGCIYLIFLGIKIFISNPIIFQNNKNLKYQKYNNYLSGLVITLSNPKVILFYCGFLPGFMDFSSLKKLEIFFVFIIVGLVLLSVLSFYSFIAYQAKLFFTSKKTISNLNKVAGIVMIATGIAVAAN